MNLLNRVIDVDKIVEKLGIDGNDSFSYSISEGGYISKDNAVILITDRRPYRGMLLPYSHDYEKAKDKWVWYLEELFKEV